MSVLESLRKRARDFLVAGFLSFLVAAGGDALVERRAAVAAGRRHRH